MSAVRVDQTFAHDAADRLVRVDAGGAVVRYRYDAAGNLVEVDAPTQAPGPSVAPPPLPVPPPGGAGFRCGSCGGAVSRDDRFCRHCGARLV